MKQKVDVIITNQVGPMSATTRRTLLQLAQEAVAVQDACNLCGVAHGFARAMSDLMNLLPGGTDACNRHPIAVLWADKIAHLSGTQTLGNDVVMNAYAVVCRIIDESK